MYPKFILTYIGISFKEFLNTFFLYKPKEIIFNTFFIKRIFFVCDIETLISVIQYINVSKQKQKPRIPGLRNRVFDNQILIFFLKK